MADPHEIYSFTFVSSSISRCACGLLNCNPQNPEIGTHAFDTPLTLHKQKVSLISPLMGNNGNVQVFILNKGLTFTSTYLRSSLIYYTRSFTACFLNSQKISSEAIHISTK